MEGQLANVFSFMIQEVTVKGRVWFLGPSLTLCYFLVVADSFWVFYFHSYTADKALHLIVVCIATGTLIFNYLIIIIMSNSAEILCLIHCLSMNCQLVKCELSTDGAKKSYNSKEPDKIQTQPVAIWEWQYVESTGLFRCISIVLIPKIEPTCYAGFEGRCVHWRCSELLHLGLAAGGGLRSSSLWTLPA